MSNLTIRIVDELRPRERHIFVLDENGKILGDLAKAVSEVRWIFVATDVAILQLDLAASYARIESLES